MQHKIYELLRPYTLYTCTFQMLQTLVIQIVCASLAYANCQPHWHLAYSIKRHITRALLEHNTHLNSWWRHIMCRQTVCL